MGRVHSSPERAAILVAALAVVASTAVLPPVVSAGPESEPNDGFDAATTIDVGEVVTGEVPEGDNDYFAVDVAAGETINVSTTLGKGDGLKVAIFDPSENQIGGTRGGEGTIHAGATAPASGTYYVRVRHWNGDQGTPYEMTVETDETTDREPNEDRGNATEISPGEEISDQRSIGDVDWYAFEAAAGETINLTGYVGPGAGLRFHIVRPDGERIQREGGSGTAILDGVTAPYSGTYYLRLSRSGGGRTGAYNVTVRTYETTDREPNEDRGNATRLQPPASVDDTISLGDVDYYAVDLQAGQTLGVTGTVGPTAGNAIHIRAPNGTRLNKSQLADGSFDMHAVARERGTYYVSVNRNSWPGADYTLDIEVTGEGSVDGGGTVAADGGDDGSGDQPPADGGLPLVPLALLLAIVVVVVAVVLWRRGDRSKRGRRKR